MNRRGFTIVELLIVIALMGILLTLSVVNLRSTQISSRDTERKTDIDTISSQLEIYYKVGTDNSTVLGRYPSTSLVGSTNIQASLRDADLRSFTPPGATSADTGFVAATNNTQTTAGVLPQPTTSTYVYQPLQQDETLCNSGAQLCTKFNLFYKLESDSLVYMKTSKNQ
jgi:prepilin-type N-terminal cleavage/methylation domain-containing protein